jgi:hypothetical protein
MPIKPIGKEHNLPPYVNDPNFKGIYSCIGWNGGKLAYLLECSTVFPYRSNVDPSHEWTRDRIRKGQLPRPINLGVRKKFISPQSFNYNSQFTRDKIKVFEVFDQQGIPHPKVVTLAQLASNDANLPKEILGRENKSSQGRGITIYNVEEWRQKFPKGRGTLKGEQAHDFYVEKLECKSEHRMHVFQGQVLCELNKRIKPGSVIHTCREGSPLVFGTIVHPKRDLMEQYAIKAVAACGLDFGAVDIFVDTKDDIYILEVNSDPGMPDAIGYLYAERFRAVFGMPPLTGYTLLSNGKVIKDKKAKNVGAVDPAPAQPVLQPIRRPIVPKRPLTFKKSAPSTLITKPVAKPAQPISFWSGWYGR